MPALLFCSYLPSAHLISTAPSMAHPGQSPGSLIQSLHLCTELFPDTVTNTFAHPNITVLQIPAKNLPPSRCVLRSLHLERISGSSAHPQHFYCSSLAVRSPVSIIVIYRWESYLPHESIKSLNAQSLCHSSASSTLELA